MVIVDIFLSFSLRDFDDLILFFIQCKNKENRRQKKIIFFI